MEQKMIDFFYPPQPTRIWPTAPLLKKLSQEFYDSEIKLNGWRLLLYKEKDIKIFNRHGTIIDIDKKLFAPFFKDIPNFTIFDGELLNFRTKDVKNIMVFFDCPFYDGQDLRNKPLSERRPFLEHFGIAPVQLVQKPVAQIYRIQQFSGDFVNIYNDVVSKDDDLEEGIVIKKKSSKYTWNNKRGIDVIDWYKVKKIGKDNYS